MMTTDRHPSTSSIVTAKMCQGYVRKSGRRSLNSRPDFIWELLIPGPVKIKLPSRFTAHEFMHDLKAKRIVNGLLIPSNILFSDLVLKFGDLHPLALNLGLFGYVSSKTVYTAPKLYVGEEGVRRRRGSAARGRARAGWRWDEGR
jgi:hypothetical protein